MNLRNSVTFLVSEKLLRFIDTGNASSQECNQQQPLFPLSWLLGFCNDKVFSNCFNIKAAKVNRALTHPVACVFIINFCLCKCTYRDVCSSYCPKYMYAPQITKHVIWYVADANLQNLVTLSVGEKLLRFIDTCDVSSQGCNQQQPWSYLSWLLGFGNNKVVSSCSCYFKAAKVNRALTHHVACIFIINFCSYKCTSREVWLFVLKKGIGTFFLFFWLTDPISSEGGARTINFFTAVIYTWAFVSKVECLPKYSIVSRFPVKQQVRHQTFIVNQW